MRCAASSTSALNRKANPTTPRLSPLAGGARHPRHLPRVQLRSRHIRAAPPTATQEVCRHHVVSAPLRIVRIGYSIHLSNTLPEPLVARVLCVARSNLPIGNLLRGDAPTLDPPLFGSSQKTLPMAMTIVSFLPPEVPHQQPPRLQPPRLQPPHAGAATNAPELLLDCCHTSARLIHDGHTLVPGGRGWADLNPMHRLAPRSNLR